MCLCTTKAHKTKCLDHPEDVDLGKRKGCMERTEQKKARIPKELFDMKF